MAQAALNLARLSSETYTDNLTNLSPESSNVFFPYSAMVLSCHDGHN
jgi:hypothetical protein